MPMGTGKKKIEIKRKEKESDRMVTFSKRRKGLFKKAHQLHSLSGSNIGLLVFSPAKKPYVYGEPSFDAIAEQYYYSMMMNNNNNKTTSTSGTSTAAQESDNNVTDIEDDEDCAETELWRSWLETMEVEEYDQADDLLAIKKDLEQIRYKLIKRIAASTDNE